MHRTTIRLTALGALALVGAAALTACGEDAESAARADVVVSDAWVRATDAARDATMTGAFMELDNAGDADVTLVAASSDVAGTVELHEMANVDGTMAMQKAAGGIEVPAGEDVDLEPGRYHVMLMDLAGELAAGDEVVLTLEFSDGSSREVTAPVKAFTEEEGGYHQHTHSSPSADTGDSDETR